MRIDVSLLRRALRGSADITLGQAGAMAKALGRAAGRTGCGGDGTLAAR
jgi:hypothetical protein